MIVHSYEWHEAELETPHVGMFWPKEYTTTSRQHATCDQCGNEDNQLEWYGVCWWCWCTFSCDFEDIPFEENDE